MGRRQLVRWKGRVGSPAASLLALGVHCTRVGYYCGRVECTPGRWDLRCSAHNPSPVDPHPRGMDRPRRGTCPNRHQACTVSNPTRSQGCPHRRQRLGSFSPTGCRSHPALTPQWRHRSKFSENTPTPLLPQDQRRSSTALIKTSGCSE